MGADEDLRIRAREWARRTLAAARTPDAVAARVRGREQFFARIGITPPPVPRTVADLPTGLVTHYSQGMEQDTSTRDDGAFDPSVGMVVTESGKARWRERLRVQRDRLTPEKLAAVRAQVGFTPPPA
jgi:hypothetical protein